MPMAQRTQPPPREPRGPARLTAMLAKDNGTVKEMTMLYAAADAFIISGESHERR